MWAWAVPHAFTHYKQLSIITSMHSLAPARGGGTSLLLCWNPLELKLNGPEKICLGEAPQILSVLFRANSANKFKWASPRQIFLVWSPLILKVFSKTIIDFCLPISLEALPVIVAIAQQKSRRYFTDPLPLDQDQTSLWGGRPSLPCVWRHPLGLDDEDPKSGDL